MSKLSAISVKSDNSIENNAPSLNDLLMEQLEKEAQSYMSGPLTTRRQSLFLEKCEPLPVPHMDPEYKKRLEEEWNDWLTLYNKTRNSEFFNNSDDGISLSQKLAKIKLYPEQAILDNTDRIAEEYSAAAIEYLTKMEIRTKEMELCLKSLKDMVQLRLPK